MQRITASQVKKIGSKQRMLTTTNVTRAQQIWELEKDWKENWRWNNIKRGYKAEDGNMIQNKQL